MGPPAVPLILEELRREPDQWSWALEAISETRVILTSRTGAVSGWSPRVSGSRCSSGDQPVAALANRAKGAGAPWSSIMEGTQIVLQHQGLKRLGTRSSRSRLWSRVR